MSKAAGGWVTLACRPRIGDSVLVPEVWLSPISSAKHWLRSSSISCMMLHSGRVLDACKKGREEESEQTPSVLRDVFLRIGGHLSSLRPLHNGDIHPALFYAFLGARRVTQTLLTK